MRGAGIANATANPIVRWMAIGAVLLALGGCLVENVPVEEEDLALLVRASDFRDLGFQLERVEVHETIEKKRYFDGSYELEYTYEPGQAFFIYSMLSIETDNAGAIMTYKATSAGFNLGYSGSEVEVVEDDTFYGYGDESRFARLMHEGDQVGNLFMTRIGRRVYTFICVGAYFDERETWAGLIEPRLVAFEAYEP